MYKQLVTDNPNRGKSPPKVIIKYQTKNNKKNTSTQTNPDNSCDEHNQKITELLSEVAITLSHKAKLEKELTILKNAINELRDNYCERKQELEHEIDDLRQENANKDALITNTKISHLEEQRELLTQISELKTLVQKLNEDSDKVIEEKKLLETRINEQREQANSLHLKVGKYKTKLKCVITYIKQMVQDINMKKNNPAGDYEINNIKSKEFAMQFKDMNIEEMMLTELFFKPNPIPPDVAEIFFTQ